MAIKHIKIGNTLDRVAAQSDKTVVVIAFTKELIRRHGLPLYGVFHEGYSGTIFKENIIGNVLDIDWKHGSLTIDLNEGYEIPENHVAYKVYEYTSIDGKIVNVDLVHGFYLDNINPQPIPIGAHT